MPSSPFPFPARVIFNPSSWDVRPFRKLSLLYFHLTPAPFRNLVNLFGPLFSIIPSGAGQDVHPPPPPPPRPFLQCFQRRSSGKSSPLLISHFFFSVAYPPTLLVVWTLGLFPCPSRNVFWNALFLQAGSLNYCFFFPDPPLSPRIHKPSSPSQSSEHRTVSQSSPNNPWSRGGCSSFNFENRYLLSPFPWSFPSVAVECSLLVIVQNASVCGSISLPVLYYSPFFLLL